MLLNQEKRRLELSEDDHPALIKKVHLEGDVDEWQTVINKCIHAIVSIRFSQVAAFDTEPPVTSEATGFVVDATRGLILTNRHVACAGPFVGEAIFQDHEEVDVYPVYRDPIHDFGFLRFDPSKIKYMKLHEIPLSPESAKVGLDIRVVGNDAGEKLSILAGSISRLDRNAPDYGDLTYNDFNTFYLQAASSTSGGSSGSPVLDIRGHAVALQAGGHTKAATDFFFPLDRVARALRFLQQKQPVPRGTIQTAFVHKPFDEAKRLGLTDASEANMRKYDPDEIGLLVVDTVLPKGPAEDLLEEGDVLITINGQYLTKFVVLEEALDTCIGSKVELGIERGGVYVNVEIQVQDLHSITPDRYVMVGGGKFNPLSYQLARQYCVAVEGVYLTEASGMFKLEHCDMGTLIKTIDDAPVRNLQEFIEVMQRIPDGHRFPVTYYSILDCHTEYVSIVQMDKHWHGFQMCIRNDETGLWDRKNLDLPCPALQLTPQTATFREFEDPCAKVFRSMVRVSCVMPMKLNGFPKTKRTGGGLIVNKETGLVLVSKSIVPYAMGDVTITVADSITLPATIVFVHPTHNLSFVRYDPALLGDTPVESATFASSPCTEPGTPLKLVAINRQYRPLIVETRITELSCMSIPISASPRFRAINFESFSIDSPMQVQCPFGVLVDQQHAIHGLWLCYLGERTESGQDHEYYLGLNVRVLSFLSSLTHAQHPALKGLGAEFVPLQIAQARTMGLTTDWIQRIEQENPKKKQMFMVRRVVFEKDTPHPLHEFDIVLAIEGRLVKEIQDLDVSESWADQIQLTILRNKQLLQIPMDSRRMQESDMRQVVHFAGAVLQAPFLATRLQSKKIPSGIYVSATTKGSPACMYALSKTQWITHVNGVAVETLDDFIAQVSPLQTNQYVRLKIMTFDLMPSVISLKMNLHYWPTMLFECNNGKWSFKEVKNV